MTRIETGSVVANIGANRDSVRVEGNEISILMTVIGLKNPSNFKLPRPGWKLEKRNHENSIEKDISVKENFHLTPYL